MLRTAGVLLLACILAGCGTVVLNPSGDVALQQRNLIIASTLLMLLIIVPVIALTLIFARRYRADNTEAVYDPEWHHSTQLEVVIWTAPLLIIIALGAITWLSTHTLDPYRPLTRIDGSQPVPPGVKPLDVQVVALDWKWLFFYPEQGIATVNELAAPVNVPIAFKITSATVMNSFFIPALAGQVYAMAGMQTQLHAVINEEGTYNGFSANYSGSGFSRMNFAFHGLTQQGFDQWVAKVKAEGTALDRAAYLELEKPSEQVPVQYFSSVENGLYDADPEHVRHTRQDVHERNASHRRHGRRRHGKPRELRAPAIRQPPHGRKATKRRPRHSRHRGARRVAAASSPKA